MEWHARWVFVTTGYPRKHGHGKTWKRANKHYKTHWSFIQRMLWIPVHKEVYEDKYKFMACLSYVHAIITFIAIVSFLLNEFVIVTFKFWQYVYVCFAVFSLLRFIYNDSIGRRKI